mmetsp:Transcript_5227/g.12688  ORF Transcript_5227/g.12688 Transcript_5227/m.12688 type:complete len:160 (-) Transcript_5227:205-684(-)
MVRFLVQEAEVEVNRRNSEGQTALFRAANSDEIETLKCLVEELGADVNVQDCEGNTVLMLAASNGYSRVASYLVQYPDTNLFLRDKQGRTALDYSSEFFRVNVLSEMRRAILHVMERDLDSLNMLYSSILKAVALGNEKMDRGRTPWNPPDLLRVLSFE